jgi:hypothetical protein
MTANDTATERANSVMRDYVQRYRLGLKATADFKFKAAARYRQDASLGWYTVLAFETALVDNNGRGPWVAMHALVVEHPHHETQCYVFEPGDPTAYYNPGDFVGPLWSLIQRWTHHRTDYLRREFDAARGGVRP